MIKASLSDHYLDKKVIKPFPKGDDKTFAATDISVEKFIRHVLSGKAWAVGIYEDNHRTKTKFIESSFLALDLDNERVNVPKSLELPEIAAHAALVHPSPSSTEAKPRTRVIFILDKPITSLEKWELAAKACLHHFAELEPDGGCAEGARRYYGCNLGKPHENPTAVLKLDTVAKWVWEYNTHLEEKRKREREERQQSPPPPPGEMTTRHEKYAEAAYQNTRNDLMSVPEGERNIMLNKAAHKLFRMARGGWPGITDGRIENDLLNDARALDLKDGEITSTLRSARNAASGHPKYLNLEEKQAPLKDYDLDKAMQEGQVYQQATMNSIQSTLQQMLSAAKLGELAVDDLQKMAEDFHTTVDSLMAMSGKVKSISGIEASRKAERLYQKALTNPQWVQGMRSNLKLDYLLGGFSEEHVATFQGATGTGKTQLCATLAANFTAQAPIMIVSMENSEEIFIMRMWAYFSGIPFGDIKRGGKLKKNEQGITIGFEPHTERERTKIREAKHKTTDLMRSGTEFLEGNPLSPAAIRSFVRKNAGKCKALFLDSLNNIQLPYYASEYENVTRAALLAEELAVNYNLSVITTVQIGRNTKGRAQKEPGIYDSRGSGIVEEKASALIAMYNHWHHVAQNEIKEKQGDEDKYPRNTVMFRPTKLRDGEAGKPTHLYYKGGCGFYDTMHPADIRG
jgi:replicative DNA helicase